MTPASLPLETISRIVGWDVHGRLRAVVLPDAPTSTWVLDLDDPPFTGDGHAGADLAVRRVAARLWAGRLPPSLLPLTLGGEPWVVRSEGELVGWDPVEQLWHGTGWPSPIAGRRPRSLRVWEAACRAAMDERGAQMTRIRATAAPRIS